MLKRMFQLTVLLTLLFFYSQERIHAQTMETTNVQHYGTGFDQYDPQHMELRTGTNGDMFNCIWEPDNIAFHNGFLSLKIDSDGHGGYTGGEWRTREYFGYGFYQVSMKPIANPGVVTSFFTYTGPSDGTRWDEIDIEFLGKDTTKVQFNYFTDGVGNHEHLFDLGFDASKEFHTYGFDWQKEHITWYVDGKAVYTASENIPITPGKIMMNAWPGIGVDHWLDAFDGKTPLYGYYDWMSYDDSKHEEQISFDHKKSYKIISQNSGQALDVAWGDKQNGTNVLQYPYGSYPNQQWHIKPTTDGYFILENSATGKVLSVEKEQAIAGSNVYQWEYQYQPNQEWKIIPAQDNLYKIANRQNGLLLNVAYASREQNANAEVYPDVDSPAQKWWIDLAD